MAEVMPEPKLEPIPNPAAAALQTAAEKLRKELDFVQRMLAAARTFEDFVAAASAAENLTESVARQSEAARGSGSIAERLGGAPLALTVLGVPAHPDWNWARTKRYLTNELGVRVAHVEKQTTSTLAVLRFFDQASCDAALQKLKGAQLGGAALEVVEGETEEAKMEREVADAARGKRGLEGAAGGRGKVGGWVVEGETEEAKMEREVADAARGERGLEGAAGGRGKVGGWVVEGETEEAKMEREVADAARGKRGLEGAAGGRGKVPRLEGSSVPDNINQVVCPWWQRPYQDQLKDKHARIVEALCNVTRDVHRRSRNRCEPDWVLANTTTIPAPTDPSPAPTTAPDTTTTTTAPMAIDGAADPAATAATTGAAAAPDATAAAGPASPAGSKSGWGAQQGGRGGRPAYQPKATYTHRTAAPLLGIIRSPQIEHYRNKNEFTCGHDVDGQPCVGFLLGGMVDGITAVGNISDTRHTSKESTSYATAMTHFLRSVTTLPPWDKREIPNEGFWRLLLVRDGRGSTFMPAATGGKGRDSRAPVLKDVDPYKYLVTVQDADDVNDPARCAPFLPSPPAGPPQALTAVEEEEPPCPPADEVTILVQVNPRYHAVANSPKLMHDQLVAFARHMRSHASHAGLALTHLVVQHHWGVANAAPMDAPLMLCPEDEDTPVGEVVAGQQEGAGGSALGSIHDSLCELRFRISPGAFFQVNAPAACVLYKLAGEWAAPSPGAVLFDVGCGTGTIGITLAHRVAQVIGIDNVPSAIDDARANAALNHLTNTTFVCGKAEDVLPDLLRKHASGGREVVAIVDPPRTGLHKQVMRALLGCKELKRLVFISCSATSLVENLTTLCSPPDGPPRLAPTSGRRGRGGHQQQQQHQPAPITPFVPVKAVAMDLFPHTTHVECVVLLERA